MLDMSKNPEILANKTREFENLNNFFSQKYDNFDRIKKALEVENAIFTEKKLEIEELNIKKNKVYELLNINSETLNDLEQDVLMMRQSKENLEKIKVFIQYIFRLFLTCF